MNYCQQGNIRITFISLMCEVRKNLNRQRTLYIFQMARGFSQSGILVETPVFAKHSFGSNHLGKMLGFFSATSAVGLAMGPRTIGMMHDTYGNYENAFYLCIGLMLFCSAIVYTLKPVYWLKLQEEKVMMASVKFSKK